MRHGNYLCHMLCTNVLQGNLGQQREQHFACYTRSGLKSPQFPLRQITSSHFTCFILISQKLKYAGKMSSRPQTHGQGRSRNNFVASPLKVLIFINSRRRQNKRTSLTSMLWSSVVKVFYVPKRGTDHKIKFFGPLDCNN